MLNKLIITSVIMLIVDYFFLTNFSNHFKQQIKLVQNKPLKMNYKYALLSYITLIIGFNYFDNIFIKANLSKNERLLSMTILGWIIYFVYEFTNGAIIQDWQLKTIILDGTWGGILFFITLYLYLSLF
jgi:uncharacterized membrane protein